MAKQMQPMDKFVSGTHIPAVWQQPQEIQTNEGANGPGTPSQITIVRIPSTKIQSKEQSLLPHNVKLKYLGIDPNLLPPNPLLNQPRIKKLN